ncbi:GNAT family N-acetyltransferase [Rheinheimera sp. WS51]|uniref:GNAT family N-acetyltransferase n=1 Tax=Rheinheimera sp. WS51 TaxID=3425886 RepID=UPI003D8A4FEE
MITIRDYAPADASALWDLFYHTIRHINSRDYSAAQVQAWAPDNYDMAAWQKRMQGLSPYIAVIDGAIVGYSDLQSTGLIDHFFCHHLYQGQGVGKALMRHIFSQGQSLAIKRYYSEVSITARPFYQKMGFTVVKQQQVLINGQKLTNFIMEKVS